MEFFINKAKTYLKIHVHRYISINVEKELFFDCLCLIVYPKRYLLFY